MLSDIVINQQQVNWWTYNYIKKQKTLKGKVAAVDVLSGRVDRKGLVQFKELNSLNNVLPFSSLTRKGLGLQLTLTLFYNSEHPPL